MKDDEDKRTTIAFHTPFLLNDNQPANNSADRKRKSRARKRNEAPSLRGRLLHVSLPTEIARGSGVLHFP